MPTMNKMDLWSIVVTLSEIWLLIKMHWSKLSTSIDRLKWIQVGHNLPIVCFFYVCKDIKVDELVANSCVEDFKTVS